jgi:predicted Zn-dependent protease
VTIARRPSGHRSAVRWLTLTVLALLVAGCGEALRNGPQVNLPEPPKAAETSPGATREHQRILAAYGGAYENPRLEALIGQTVDKLVAASERPNLKYRVTILNSSAVNAFALPNGQLYVTRGLLALANDTSELASVLSHEMAHVIARHAAIREDQAKQDALLSRVAEISSDPQGTDRMALALARSKIKIASFSRAQELEADGIGVGISSRAGYDPYGAVRFLTAMGRNAELRTGTGAGDARFLDFLSSHPGTPERLKVARANARQYTAPVEVGRGDREAYLAGIDGLVYGEDPSDGFVRGRRFMHPRLAFTFTAPEGFTLENTAQAVLGVSQNGALALRLDIVRVPSEQTLSEYLLSGWIENVDAASVEALTINGFPAASATATGDQWTFRLYAVRFGSEVYRFIFAVKQKTADADRIFRDSVATFRRMSLNEVERARPLHLQTVTVAPGDTAEKLAGRMATDKPLERFLVINGLSHGEALKAGDRVKIVVE